MLLTPNVTGKETGNLMAPTLTFALAAIAIVLFAWGVFAAGYYTIKKRAPEMPVFLERSVTSIGGVLALNLGAVVGLDAANAGAFATQSMFSASLLLSGSVSGVQLWAAYLYAFFLVVALVLWGVVGFKVNEAGKPKVVVDTLPELSRTLVGVVVGVIAILLGVSATGG